MKGRELVAGLMFYHGGGYMIGSPEAYDPLTRQLAEELDIVIASVDYCLATKHKFPAAHEDSMKALRFFLIHASEFGVDPARIGVAGDSAGGHLAAAVAQEASDDPSLPRLKIQVLLYPLLQLLDLQTPSYQKYMYDFGSTGGVLTEPTLGIMRCVYLLGRIDEDFITAFRVNNHTSLTFKKDNPTYYNHELVPAGLRKHVSYKGPVMEDGNDEMWAKYKHLFKDPRVSPLMRKNLSSLPPAYIVSCQYDSLRDDAIMYAARLEAAGIETKLVNYYNGWHGMFNAPHFEVGRRAIKYLVQHLKTNL
ncbi:arylacetamide deacetylase-like [Asterias rubens]|uniref:arylacetamide deacetylase-like n=1 Tax=Asterias rubens TaxID=7604 RepID=UPI001455C07B|nr:arylacetamide deacetylase-like [Asterias rubens]